MLLANRGVVQEDGWVNPSWSDWLNAILLLTCAAASVHVGGLLLQSVVFPPGSELQHFFITQRPVDDKAIAGVAIVLALALLLTLVVWRGASWISHWDAAPTALFRRWQVLGLFAFALTQLMNSADIRIDTGGQSRRFYSLFTPAPWAFSIWGVIYIGERLFVVYQALPLQRGNVLLAAIAPYWILANGFQFLWCFVFCPYASEMLYISTLFLLLVAVALFGAYYHFTSLQNKYYRSYGWMFWIFAQIPLTLHFGWISAALLVNFNGFLVRWGAPLAVQLAVATACLYIAAALGILLMLSRFDFIYGLTIAWAVNGVRYGTERCLGNSNCLQSLPGITAEALKAQILTAEFLTALLLAVALWVMLVKLARQILMNTVSYEVRDRFLKHVPEFLLTYLE
jgi:hypothetical protein